MFGWRKRDDRFYERMDDEPRHFIVRAEGHGFRHDRAGRVGFFTGRPITAPHEDNALAQARALIPVQLMPFGVPEDDFSVTLTVTVAPNARMQRKVPLSGFVFFPEEN